MITGLEKLKLDCGAYDIVPVAGEVFSDIRTPIEVLKVIKSISKKCFLLESVEGGEKWGRYSFLGYDPILEIKCLDNEMEIRSANTVRFKTDNPGEEIRKILKQYRSPKVDNLPPFTGGFVGYFAYDYFKYTEPKFKINKKLDTDTFDVDLMLFDKVIAFDNLKQKIVFIINVKTDELEENYLKAKTEIESLIRLIKTTNYAPSEKGELKTPITAVFDEHQYESAVNKAKDYIVEGDIFQVVPSNRRSAEFSGSLLNAYRVLRTTNPSPYMFYLKKGDLEITGTSPETLVKLVDGSITTFPIAGTKPRGKTESEDSQYLHELETDPKERAEHNMLVDLSRNDLGKVSKYGSVKVKDYLKVNKFSHVMHLTSTVTGELKKECDAIDALQATLPAGTLSGAPKLRACQIIEELETVRRGIYGGAIGYIDFTGNMDMCIAIRMAVKSNGKVYISSGGGIVADSDPQKEYEESCYKAQAIVNALILSEEVDN